SRNVTGVQTCALPISNKTIGKMGSKIADTGGRMKDFGRNSHASMAMPLMTVAGVAGYTGVTFDKQMSMVRSVTGATGKDFNMLEIGRASCREGVKVWW